MVEVVKPSTLSARKSLVIGRVIKKAPSKC